MLAGGKIKKKDLYRNGNKGGTRLNKTKRASTKKKRGGGSLVVPRVKCGEVQNGAGPKGGGGGSQRKKPCTKKKQEPFKTERLLSKTFAKKKFFWKFPKGGWGNSKGKGNGIRQILDGEERGGGLGEGTKNKCG